MLDTDDPKGGKALCNRIYRAFVKAKDAGEIALGEHEIDVHNVALIRLANIAYRTASQPVVEPSWTCPDCCVQPCRCEVYLAQPDTFDYHCVREWAKSCPRKAANAAFTAGTDRNVAYLIEELEDAQPVADAGLVERVARALAKNAGDEDEWMLWTDEAKVAISAIPVSKQAIIGGDHFDALVRYEVCNNDADPDATVAGILYALSPYLRQPQPLSGEMRERLVEDVAKEMLLANARQQHPRPYLSWEQSSVPTRDAWLCAASAALQHIEQNYTISMKGSRDGQ